MDEVSQHNIIFLSNCVTFFCQIAPYIDFFIDIQEYIEVKAKKKLTGKIDFISFSNTRQHMCYEINRSVSF